MLGVVQSGRPPDGALGTLRRFVARYGWRAYALPVLTVLTVVTMTTTIGTPARRAASAEAPHAAARADATGSGSGVPMAPGQLQLKADSAGANANEEALPSDALPPGAPYSQRGAGTFQVLPGSSPVVGTGVVRHYTVEVENGITGVDTAGFAAKVVSVLSDPRSWTKQHDVALQRVDSGPVDFRVTLTSSMTVRQLCGYELRIETSCWSPQNDDRVVLNIARWIRGDVAYVGDLDAYHVYMINHESGHALGHSHAHACLSGGLAPVMMQQTISLKATNAQMCQANPWPFPPGVTGAPGTETPGT
jgi:Protein of unknown function (DUF3152)